MPQGTPVILAQAEYTLTIANSATNSTAHRTSGMGRGSFQVGPFTGTTVTVQGSNDNQSPTNWTNVGVEGNEVNPTTSVVDNGAYSLPLKTFNFKWFRLVSGSSEGAERTIRIFAVA
jgi:hypothetical protein